MAKVTTPATTPANAAETLPPPEASAAPLDAPDGAATRLAELEAKLATLGIEHSRLSQAYAELVTRAETVEAQAREAAEAAEKRVQATMAECRAWTKDVEERADAAVAEARAMALEANGRTVRANFTPGEKFAVQETKRVPSTVGRGMTSVHKGKIVSDVVHGAGYVAHLLACGVKLSPVR